MKRLLKILFFRITDDNLSFFAGGVAFYGLLALFPAMAAMVSLFGLIAEPQVIREQLEAVRALFPPNVFDLIKEQLIELTKAPGGTLSLTILVSIIMAVSSAMRGTKAMLAALNMVFRVTETRTWWRKYILGFGMTFGAIILLCVTIFLIVAIPLAFQLLSPELVAMIAQPLSLIRWAILGGAVLVGLMALYAFGPNRPIRQQRLIAIFTGASSATILWLLAAIGGSWFVGQVPQLHAAYGSISAVIVLMLWMLVSAYAVLIGAAITSLLDGFEDKENAETA